MHVDPWIQLEQMAAAEISHVDSFKQVTSHIPVLAISPTLFTERSKIQYLQAYGKWFNFIFKLFLFLGALKKKKSM